MTRLPQISSRELVRALEQIGYQAVRQRGSHIRLTHPVRRPTTVPAHKVVGKGLLRKILRDTDVTVEELRKLLKG